MKALRVEHNLICRLTLMIYCRTYMNNIQLNPARSIISAMIVTFVCNYVVINPKQVLVLTRLLYFVQLCNNKFCIQFAYKFILTSITVVSLAINLVISLALFQQRHIIDDVKDFFFYWCDIRSAVIPDIVALHLFGWSGDTYSTCINRDKYAQGCGLPYINTHLIHHFNKS